MQTTTDSILPTARLHLRLLGPDQAREATRYLLRNRQHFGAAGPLVDDEYFTEEYQRRRLIRELELMDEGTLFRLWIFLRSSSRDEYPIGDISMSHIIRGIMHSCFLGYKLDSEHVGNGFMTEALGAAVEFAFDSLGLHRLEANIMPANTASIRVVEKLEFVNEGYSSKYLMINGEWQDHIRFAKVNGNWAGGRDEQR